MPRSGPRLDTVRRADLRPDPGGPLQARARGRGGRAPRGPRRERRGRAFRVAGLAAPAEPAVVPPRSSGYRAGDDDSAPAHPGRSMGDRVEAIGLAPERKDRVVYPRPDWGRSSPRSLRRTRAGKLASVISSSIQRGAGCIFSFRPAGSLRSSSGAFRRVDTARPVRA